MLELQSLNKKQLQELYAYLENYKMSYREKLDIPTNLSFGIEIEYYGIPFTTTKKILKDEFPKWYTYRDLSVTKDINGVTIGAETTSPILHDTKNDWQEIKRVYDKLAELGAYITTSCAFHTHIGAQILGEDFNTLKKLIKTWCVFEPVLFRFGYGYFNRARDNMLVFTKPLRSVYTSKKVKKNLNEASTTKELDFGKNWALSLHNLHYLSPEEENKNDIEIRLCNGTLDSVLAQNYLNVFLKLLIYVQSNNYNTKLIDKLFKSLAYYDLSSYGELDIQNALLFADLVFSSELDKVNFLATYLKKDDYMLLRTLH